LQKREVVLRPPMRQRDGQSMGGIR